MMSKLVIKSVFTVGLLIMLMAVPVYGASVNKSISIDAGEKSDGANTVNGSIRVGESAVVTGTLRTVNGKIRVGDNATIEDAFTVNGSLRLADGVTADDLETVNGAILLGQNTRIDGAVEAVNGRISLEQGSRIKMSASNVNGDIELAGGEIGGDLSTVNGDIYLSAGAVVQGDVIVEKPSVWNFGNSSGNTPKIVIGPGTQVQGTIRLERKVELYISTSAKVGAVEGEMSMDDAIRFKGDRP
jgi:DUF4097 and DUF4098 domain-containing protein YvlB